MTRIQVRAYMSFGVGTIHHMPGFWYFGRLLRWFYNR